MYHEVYLLENVLITYYFVVLYYFSTAVCSVYVPRS